jgi:hypothetical protein
MADLCARVTAALVAAFSSASACSRDLSEDAEAVTPAMTPRCYMWEEGAVLDPEQEVCLTRRVPVRLSVLVKVSPTKTSTLQTTLNNADDAIERALYYGTFTASSGTLPYACTPEGKTERELGQMHGWSDHNMEVTFAAK